LSFTTRKHCPDAGSQTLAVQSKDADNMKSLVNDQSKSDKKKLSTLADIAKVLGGIRGGKVM